MSNVTGLQRCQAVLAGGVADRVPVVPQTFMFAAETAGIKVGEMANSAARMVEAQVVSQEKYGYDGKCPQCQHFQKYGRGKAGHEHTKQCRARLTTAIGGTEEGRRRFEEYQERTNRSLAEHFEWQDKHQVLPVARVPQEFRPLQDIDPTGGRGTGHTSEAHREEAGSGLPSGSAREERRELATPQITGCRLCRRFLKHSINLRID